MGNHENFVYKYVKGEIQGTDPELLRTYFDSTQVLKEDTALFSKFSALVEQSQPFYRYIGMQGPSFMLLMLLAVISTLVSWIRIHYAISVTFGWIVRFPLRNSLIS